MKELRFLTEISYQLNQVMKAKESFERENPDVRIVVQQSADSFEAMQALQSDEPPDIIEIGGYPVANPKGIFCDLNPFAAEIEGLEEDFYPELMRFARRDGTLPALPVEVMPPLILFNKEMFDRAGLRYPTEEWTWDEMAELGKRLTLRSDDGVARQFGFSIEVDIEFFEPFIMRNGGRYIAPDGSASRGYVDSPATIDAFRKIIEAFRVHQIIRKPGEPVVAEHWYEESAMRFTFHWYIGDLKRENALDRFGVVGLPKMPGNIEANMLYAGGAGVTTKSENPRLAWDFLRHYILELPSWTLPITKSQAERHGFNRHPIFSRYMKELDHIQTSGYYLNGKWNAARQLINKDIHRMILEGADVAQTLRSWTRYT